MNFAAQMKQAEQLARENYGLVIVPVFKRHVLPTLLHDPWGFQKGWENLTEDGPSGYYTEMDWPTFEDSPKYDFFTPIMDCFKAMRAKTELDALMQKVYDRYKERGMETFSLTQVPHDVIDKPVAAHKEPEYRVSVEWVRKEEPHPSGIPWAKGPNDSGMIRTACGGVGLRLINKQEPKE